jgi:hypothetical protein
MPMHFEVPLPAFAIAWSISYPHNAEIRDIMHQDNRISNVIIAIFMALVGLSMPPLIESFHGSMEWPEIIITLLSNLGKNLPCILLSKRSFFKRENRSFLRY